MEKNPREKLGKNIEGDLSAVLMNRRWFPATTIAFGALLLIILLQLGRIDIINQTENIKTKRVFTVLTLGDSLTAGLLRLRGRLTWHPYADLMNKACSLIQADSIGMSGWTTGQLVNTTNELRITDGEHNDYEGQGLSIALSHKKYDLVCIMAGTNDLGHGLKTELIKENLQRLHDTVLRAGVKSLAIGIPESHMMTRSGESLSHRVRRIEVNNFLRELSERKFGMFYVDSPLNLTMKALYKDGVHFTEEGYKHFSQGILHKIKTIPGFEGITF